VKKPGAFPQGTQRIARIGELCEPNAYVLEPATPVEPEQIAPAVEGTISDAEIASAFVGGDAPVAVGRARRATSAYAAQPAAGPRRIVTIA
jgi:hypothetical protein